MPVLETHGLVKRYGRLEALKDLTLSIKGGAIGLLGPNGAGKSTLIRILLGLIPPSAGSASVFGLDTRRFAIRIRQQVGYMPENESFIPGLDAVTYVYLAGRLVGMPHVDAMQRTHVTLNYVGLGEERYRPVETYSTGMKQKAKFAQALVHHPKLLLLDEPTVGLDPSVREEMLALIRDVSHGKGIDVILSTHILRDVEEVCDEAAIMDGGTLVAQSLISRLPEGTGYEVRIKGDRDAFARALSDQQCRTEPIEDGSFRVDGPTAPILRAATESGVQLRHLSRSRTTLEELFESLLRARHDGNH